MEKKPNNIIDHFHGRLYKKEEIEKWDLPASIQSELSIEEFKYYFLTTSIEREKHGQEHHTHFCLFPTEHELVFLLEVETPKILPELLAECLQKVKRGVKNILTSTGFCKTKDLCYFGIFFSFPEGSKGNLKDLRSEVEEIDQVRKVRIFKYTTESKEPLEA